MNRYEENLRGIIDFDMRNEFPPNTGFQSEIASLERKYHLHFPEDYRYYLSHYGNDYVKENLEFFPEKKLPASLQLESVEVDSLFGMYPDENNLEDRMQDYESLLSAGFIPIGDLPGGDIICMEKDGTQIYFWFHDLEGENLFLVADSFESFVSDFRPVDPKEETNLDNIDFTLDDDLDAALRRFSQGNR